MAIICFENGQRIITDVTVEDSKKIIGETQKDFDSPILGIQINGIWHLNKRFFENFEIYAFDEDFDPIKVYENKSSLRVVVSGLRELF